MFTAHEYCKIEGNVATVGITDFAHAALGDIFFVDLPDAATRSEILSIHLTRRQHAPASFDLQQLASLCEGFTGAEIEQAILSASYESHAAKQPLATIHIASEIARTRPLSVVMAESMNELRAWAQARAVLA